MRVIFKLFTIHCIFRIDRHAALQHHMRNENFDAIDFYGGY